MPSEVSFPRLSNSSSHTENTFFFSQVKRSATRIEVSFTAFGQEFRLDLIQNWSLFASRYLENHDNLNGSLESTESATHCFYHGTVRGKEKSTVSLSTCDGMEGLVSNGETSFYIEPTRDALYRHLHIFYRLKDLHLSDFYSGVAEILPENSKVYSSQHFDYSNRTRSGSFNSRQRRHRREVYTETKYVELFIINDNSQFEVHGKNLSRTNLRAKQIANLVDAIFKPLNVRVALVGMETWTVADKVKTDADAGTYLSNVAKYRGKKLLRLHPNDVTQLLTGISLKDSIRGKAQVMSICTRQSAGLVQDYSSNPAFTANTFAHELGHVLGMYHDEDLPNCICQAASSQGCVMSAHVNREPATVFSNCSVDGLQKTLARGLGTCLFDVPKLLFGGSVCGDGITQHGEECDCGTLEDCISLGHNCCDHVTCKLRAHAQCSSGDCCENCRFKKRGTSCRNKVNECDITEYCTGDSGICPSDIYVHDGYPCSNNTAYCYWGKCLTHDQQCQDLWGNTAISAPDMCYRYHNTQKDSKFGHCKKTRKGTYIACKLRNAKCGKLWCLSSASLPVVGIERSVMKSLWPYGDKTVTCKGSSLQMGLDIPEPSMTSEGTKCAEGKICLKRRCVSVSEIFYKGSVCPKNCSGNGVCSNLGECHCFVPWAGVHCDINYVDLKTTVPATDKPSGTPSVYFKTEHFSTETPPNVIRMTTTEKTARTQSPTPLQETYLMAVYIAVPLFTIALLVGFVLVLCRFTHLFDRVNHKHQAFVLDSNMKRDVRAKLRVQII